MCLTKTEKTYDPPVVTDEPKIGWKVFRIDSKGCYRPAYYKDRNRHGQCVSEFPVGEWVEDTNSKIGELPSGFHLFSKNADGLTYLKYVECLRVKFALRKVEYNNVVCVGTQKLYSHDNLHLQTIVARKIKILP